MDRPLPEILSRFTPDSSALDRDALLFAAGRASARPNRRWIALAGCLALCQVLTLAVLWPRPARPATPGAAPGAVVPSPLPELPSPTPSTPAAEGPLVRSPHLRPLDEDIPRPELVKDLVPDAPPLRAFVGAASPVD